MYAEVKIRMPLNHNGAPTVDQKKVLADIATDISCRVAEGYDRGRKIFHDLSGKPVEITWHYKTYAEIGPPVKLLDI